jgi:predicted NAD/FAD-dependent oxidoreductase
MGRSAPELSTAVLSEAREWFGQTTTDWEFVGGFTIERALPIQTPPYFSRSPGLPQAVGGVFRCGDYLTSGSIQGALLSGRLTAQKVIEQLKG